MLSAPITLKKFTCNNDTYKFCDFERKFIHRGKSLSEF